MVVVAFGLAALGIALAVHQAPSLTVRRIAEAARHAGRIAVDARVRFDGEVNTVLTDVIVRQRSASAGPWRASGKWPAWVDGAYVWNGSDLTTLRPSSVKTDAIASVVASRLELRFVAAPGSGDLATALLYDNVADLPIVLACRHAAATEGGKPILAAVRIDVTSLKRDLVDPLVTGEYGLEVIPVSQANSVWARPMFTAMRFWAIQPTEAFQEAQGAIVVGQTFVYVSLTMLALMTLLVAMWFLIRIARKETALAQMKADFVANVSHELKTPLALIRMFAETLEAGRVASEEKRQEYYSVITRESVRLTALIENVLDFARIDAGRKEYMFQPVDVGAVVRETYETYRPQLEYKGFRHDLTIAEDLPTADVDRSAIAQAVVNLIGNAVKYCDDEKSIAISVTADTLRNRRGVLISVIDSGIGVTPEDRRFLFEGFFRAEDTRVRERAGTGLGLALVKHIVDAHGGSLDVESRLVKGTAFRIFLPCTHDPDAREPDAPPEEAKDQPDAPGDASASDPRKDEQA